MINFHQIITNPHYIWLAIGLLITIFLARKIIFSEKFWLIIAIIILGFALFKLGSSLKDNLTIREINSNFYYASI